MIFGMYKGPPAVTPHWLKISCDFFPPARLVNHGVAASFDTWLNS